MENKSHAFWAGLFTIGLVLAIAFTVFFFNVDRTVRVPYDLIARTNVTGLFTDAAVRYRGLGVGKVESIRFDQCASGADPHPHSRRQERADDAFHLRDARLPGRDGHRVRAARRHRQGHARRCRSSAKHVAEVPMRPGIFDQLQQRGDVILRKFERLSDDADKFLSDDVRDQLMAHDEEPAGRGGRHRDAREPGRPGDGALPQTLKQLDTHARVDQRARSRT